MTGIEHTRSWSQPRERVFFFGFDKVKWFALIKGALSRPLPRPTSPRQTLTFLSFDETYT